LQYDQQLTIVLSENNMFHIENTSMMYLWKLFSWCNSTKFWL